MVLSSMASQNTESKFQKKFRSIMIVLVLCLNFSQSSFAFASESTTSMAYDTDSVKNPTGILTLQVLPIFPQDGTVLTNFPTNLEVKVVRGGIPVQGARVQFWMEGGSTDAAMHNAGLTMTDSSGYAYLTLLNQHTLEQGQYVWYATAYQSGFKSGSSQTASFTIPFTAKSITNGAVSTDKKEYSLVSGNGTGIVIRGNVNSYHLGQPIVLEITSPLHKTVKLVAYGTYLGSFQRIYKLEPDSEIGMYVVTVYHNYAMSSQSVFYVVK